jgi:hypothetical protein
MVHYEWTCIIKYKTYGSIDNKKACIVAKLFSEVKSIIYYKIFSHVAKMYSKCLVLSLISSQG